MIVAPIPVCGRFPLVTHTIKRLKDQGVIVICIGHEPMGKKIADYMDVEWIEYSNDLLGSKWNTGFLAAKKYNPEGVLFMGSSDLMSSNYLTESSKYLKEYDLIGMLGCYFADLNKSDDNKKNDEIRLVKWNGYGDGDRENEPIGIGRLLSSRILDEIGWKPFNDELNSSLDFSMWEKVLNSNGKIKILDDNNLKLLSISTNLWRNKHKFEQHWNNILPSEKIYDKSFFLDFKEIFDI